MAMSVGSTSTMTRSFEIVFETEDHDAAGVRTARDAIASWLECRDEVDELRSTLRLVASELVTNALRHTTGYVQVTIGHVLGGVKIRVFDESLELPWPHPTSVEGTSGRGLVILDALTDAWGAHHAVVGGRFGKVVWATCGRP